MNKYFFIIISFIFVNVKIAHSQTFSGGDGSESDPYLITSVDDLKEIAQHVNNSTAKQRMSFTDKYFRLENDIIFESANNDFTPIGKNTSYYFGGVFDGNNHSIENFKININSKTDYIGLFGYIRESGCIKNLTIKNAQINVNNSSGNSYIGGIVGCLDNQNQNNVSIINCCAINCRIIANDTKNHKIGGIIGQVLNKDNGYKITVNNNSAINVYISKGEYVGGICGELQVIEYTNSYEFTNNFTCNNILETKLYSNNIVGNIDDSYFTNNTSISDDNKLILYTNTWNFIGGSNKSCNIFNNNFFQNDVAIIDYNYTDNSWNGNFLVIQDSMRRGQGYFVWIFNNSVNSEPLNNHLIYINNDYLMSNGTVKLNNNEWYKNDIPANIQGIGGVTTQTGKWFALGNPFDKSLSINDIMQSINNIQGENNECIYTYNPLTLQWENPNEIKPGQGFMVAVTESNGNNLTGALNYPTSSENQLSNTNISNDIIFNCQSNNTTCFVHASIKDVYSNGFDDKDGYILFSTDDNSVQPYFVVDNYCIKHNKFSSIPYSYPINFHSDKENIAQISLASVDTNIQCSIIDLQNNTETIFDDSTIFKFTAYQGENANRFLIKFTYKNNSIITANSDNPTINIKDNNIYINGNNLKYYEIINNLGQIIETKSLNNSSSILSLSNIFGIYIIKVYTNNSVTTKQFVIQ